MKKLLDYVNNNWTWQQHWIMTTTLDYDNNAGLCQQQLDYDNNNWTMTTIPHDEEHHQMMTYNITSWHTTLRDDIQHCVVIYNIKKWPNIAWWYATAHDDTQHSMMIYNTEWWNATAFDNIQHHIMTYNITSWHTTSHVDIQHRMMTYNIIQRSVIRVLVLFRTGSLIIYNVIRTHVLCPGIEYIIFLYVKHYKLLSQSWSALKLWPGSWRW